MWAWYWPALNAFALAVLYVPGIIGSATTPRWAVASLSLFYIRFWPLCFAAYCFYMLRLEHAAHWAVVCAAFSWGTRCGDEQRESVVLAVAGGIICTAPLIVLQWFGYEGVEQAAIPAGLFINKNVLGEAACLAFVACLGERKTWWALALLAVVAMTGCRSALLALLLITSLSLPMRVRLAALVSAAVLAWFFLDHRSFDERLMLWQTFSFSWVGNGSWSFNTLQFDAYDHMHNDWLQLIHELGIAGLFPLCVVLCACLVDRAALLFGIAVLAIGAFGFPLQMPATAWFAAFMLGTCFFVSNDERRISLRGGFSTVST